MKNITEYVLLILKELGHVSTRVPYTYHHDYVRANVPAFESLSRSEIANLACSSTEDELHAACLCQILSGLSYRDILLNPIFKQHNDAIALHIIPACDAYIERLKIKHADVAPFGYYVLENYPVIEKDMIAVGVSFFRFNDIAPEIFHYNNVAYKRDMMDCVPEKYQNQLCSVRLYKKIQ